MIHNFVPWKKKRKKISYTALKYSLFNEKVKTKNKTASSELIPYTKLNDVFYMKKDLKFTCNCLKEKKKYPEDECEPDNRKIYLPLLSFYRLYTR